MSGLKLRNVRKSFGTLEVIKGVDLDIEDKQFVVFVGPSGCGKSTLLRMIAGLEEITSGELTIGEKRMNDVDPAQRGIAMVFQSYALYPHMTVRENMGFALRFAGKPKDEIARRVEEAARILELGALLDRKPGQLSGGQRQRVAIGRAIVRHPDVFLFDEPLSNLDAELRVHMRIELARLHKELQTTIIYVTHDQVEAMTLADKIVVLRDGLVEQDGTPLELYDDPSNHFVAGFIGSPKMNFLGGVAEEGGIRLSDFPGQLVPSPVSLDAGTPVTVGIRPEHFSSTGTATLDVAVEIIEHLGGETYAYARGDGPTLLTLATDNDRTLKAGDRYTARFDPGVLLVFDKDGKRLR
ncbi:lactose/L-arabinose transport system ATP-binding protein [Devosia crocina]|uniref:Lactose/L-arabinose transport system ATP-binding protein n=1 Tax=Devosia crocina TaxID=429728 RepID=A0A1I7NLQ2_9HYPH|nr:sn-glycerol-3-phosphate ABC transporter ATP-binding protein UgpC [Devosia crocina]SFV35567.1 lactose/L-arabinose transport system ATP-binding protein [Devosia crocina]